MVTALLLSAALGAGSLVLPASPEGIGVGDVDGDSKNEVVLLLVWPSWSSIAVSTSSEPALYQVEVKPAIEDRRELWVLRAGDGRIERVGAPLSVGREVIAIGPLEPAGPVVVLDDAGVSRVVLRQDDSGEVAPALERIASMRPLMAGIGSPLGSFSLLTRLGRDEPPRISVPIARGLAFVDPAGGRRDFESPFREVSSGARGSVGFPLPRRVDVDRDGRFELLSIDRRELRAALERTAPDGSFAASTVWDLRPLVEPEAAVAEDRQLVDVLDSDGDGVLEAVVGIQQAEAEGIRGGMRLMRGVPGEYRFFPLAADGSAAREPSERVAIEGHPADFDHPQGWVSPFRDLDGDGRPELLTFTVKLGYLGVAKAMVTKKMKMGWVIHVYRRGDGGFRELPDGAPRFEFTADLANLDASRFVRLPGDLDGDGREDLVQVAGREVQIHAGLPGARISDKPTRVIRLEDKIRDFLGLLFVDLDGDGRRELIAFEEQPQVGDEPAKPVRMELRTLEEQP